MRPRVRYCLPWPLALTLIACNPQAPIRVGFIGGLSDRVSDVGQAGHNGVLLAVEKANRNGGIQGRMIELVTRDDSNSRETAARAAQELVDARVDAVIGPFSMRSCKPTCRS